MQVGGLLGGGGRGGDGGEAAGAWEGGGGGRDGGGLGGGGLWVGGAVLLLLGQAALRSGFHCWVWVGGWRGGWVEVEEKRLQGCAQPCGTSGDVPRKGVERESWSRNFVPQSSVSDVVRGGRELWMVVGRGMRVGLGLGGEGEGRRAGRVLKHDATSVVWREE